MLKIPMKISNMTFFTDKYFNFTTKIFTITIIEKTTKTNI